MKDFRADTDIIDSTAVVHYSSIYEELLHEVSHNDPNYIDPAVAVRAIMNRVDDVFQDYFLEAEEATKQFSREMVELGSSLLLGTSYTQLFIDTETTTVYFIDWKEPPALAITDGMELA